MHKLKQLFKMAPTLFLNWLYLVAMLGFSYWQMVFDQEKLVRTRSQNRGYLKQTEM
jgi:hypothetical protein